MLIIEIELLTGRYAATEHNDRSRAEWPPHPARFFSALVAALHDRDPVDDADRQALLWLQQQGAPLLDVDVNVNEITGRREVRAVFVPINDVTLVGNNPEGKLREVRRRLTELEQLEQTREVLAVTTKTRKELESETKKLVAFFAAQKIAPAKATQKDLELGAGLLPDRRNRQERTFPVVVPERTSFAFLWPESDPGKHLDALHRLCDRVTRLGHSSSLVRCAIIIDPSINPTLVPREDGEHVLRVVGPKQLEQLESAYKRHQAAEARVLPSRPQRYGDPLKAESELPHSVFTDSWIIFERVGGHRPLASRGSDLSVALRRALLEIHGKEDLPAMLSGHDPNGERSTNPHVAFVPLPWVGNEYADGSVQGLAMILPRSIASVDRGRLLRLVAKWETERGDATDGYVIALGTPAGLGRPINLRIRRIDLPSKTTLNPARWCNPSRKFITVTPVALDRHPGNLSSNVERASYRAAAEAQSSIAQACERIGLPRPSTVSISLAPLLPGAQHVRQFAPWPARLGRGRRALVHAEVEFSQEVCGPLLIGAGRYFGLGLCLPFRNRYANQQTRTS